MRITTIYQKIASLSKAIENCQVSKNTEWEEKHSDALRKIMVYSPSGSGFDHGTELVSSDDKRIVFTTAFHHMTEHGYYDGWTEHEVIIIPSFDGINIRVTGKNRNDIKEYISETFYTWLNSEYKIS